MSSVVPRGFRLPFLAHSTSPARVLAGGASSSSSTTSLARPAASAVHALSPCLANLALVKGQTRRSVTTASGSSNGHLADDAATMALHQRRFIHSSDRRTTTASAFPEHPIPIPEDHAPIIEPATGAPLSVLPLSMILRSLATTTVSSSPVLLPPSLRIMAALAHSTNPLLNPDRNPVLRYFIKRTFYAQFCAGENSPEVRSTIGRLKNIGFTGVILGYAREVVLSDKDAAELAAGKVIAETEEVVRSEIQPWTDGVLETVRLAEPGDYVGVKFTGAGRLALFELSKRLEPSPQLTQSIDSICQLAAQRNVRLLFDAEQDALQDGIDDWTMQFARKYNTEKAVVYGTYQSYKKCTAANLAQHLAMAKKEGFVLGVKLVRGAYLGSDPRHRLHDTKEETDVCYDGIAASVLTQQWTAVVRGEGEFPEASLVLATHNADSVRRARAICDAGSAKSEIAFAQLQGMADEVSCELVEAMQSQKISTGKAPTLPVFKYLVWGSTGECMKYLLRRAQENKDAVQRTRDGRDAMLAEVIRRTKAFIGFA